MYGFSHSSGSSYRRLVASARAEFQTVASYPRGSVRRRAASLCAGHAQQLGGESPLADLMRSEEHTSELQSQSNLVCRLLLEKKKKAIDSTVRPEYREAAR